MAADGRLPNCRLCGECVAACPTGARQMVGREMSVEDVMAEVLKDRLFFEQSGGGVTFSGGEPLGQPGFLLRLLEACHAAGLHTAVDTCGVAPLEDLLAVARHTDLFLYDLKHVDPQKHESCTGQSNESILANFEALGRIHGNIWVRVPVIPGVNDDSTAMVALARVAASVPGVARVSLLPYHKIGTHKGHGPQSDREKEAREKGTGAFCAKHPEDRPAKMSQSPVREPTTETLDAAASHFRAEGLCVDIGG